MPRVSCHRSCSSWHSRPPIDDPADQARTAGQRRRFRTYSVSSKKGAESVSALLADPDGERLIVDDIAPITDQGGQLRAFADRRGRFWFASDRELLLVERGPVDRFTAWRLYFPFELLIRQITGVEASV